MHSKVAQSTLRSMAIIGSMAAVASLSTGSTAQAQALFTGSGCSGHTFEFCASWTATYIDADHLLLFLTNTSDDAPASNTNSLFTQIAIGNVTVADPVSIAAVTGWEFDSNINGFSALGLLENHFGARTTNGISNALADGNSLTLNFTFGSSIGSFSQAQIAFSGAQIGITDGGNPVVGASCSSQGVLQGQTEHSNNYNGTNCATSTVPEPKMWALMASGLIGMFSVVRRRRIA